jgi:hypothetical protein
MKLPVRPALPDTTVDNDAPLTRPSSTYKPGNVVQTSGATSQRGTFKVGQKPKDGFFLCVADCLALLPMWSVGDQQAVLMWLVGFVEEFIDIVFGDVVVVSSTWPAPPSSRRSCGETRVTAAVSTPAFGHSSHSQIWSTCAAHSGHLRTIDGARTVCPAGWVGIETVVKSRIDQHFQ